MIHCLVGDVLARRGRTRYWLAKQAGLTQPTIYKLCRGDVRRLDLDTLARVCAVLKVQPGALLAYVPEGSTAKVHGRRR